MMPVDTLRVIGSFLPPTKISERTYVPKLQRSPNEAFVTQAHVIILNDALKQLKISASLYPFSLVNKEWNVIFAKNLEENRNLIVESIEKIQLEDRGAKCFRECADSGFYVSVLKVYYIFRPKALY